MQGPEKNKFSSITVRSDATSRKSRKDLQGLAPVAVQMSHEELPRTCIRHRMAGGKVSYGLQRVHDAWLGWALCFVLRAGFKGVEPLQIC